MSSPKSQLFSSCEGEMDDQQKEEIEGLQDRIRKQEEDLFNQRKQLVQLSALVEEQQKELLSKGSQLKEQIFICNRQEEEIKGRGKEMVQMQKEQDTERVEHDVEMYQLEQEVSQQIFWK